MKQQLTPVGARRIIRQHLAGTLEHRRDGSSPLNDALVVLLRQGASKATTGRARRRKGHDYEREIARIFQGFWPGAKRGGQGRDGGDAPDVDGTPLWVEVKRLKQIAALRFMEQAQRDTDGRPPVVVMREDKGAPVAMMPLELLLGMLHAVDGCNMPSIVKRGAEMIDAQSAAARMKLGTNAAPAPEPKLRKVESQRRRYEPEP